MAKHFILSKTVFDVSLFLLTSVFIRYITITCSWEYWWIKAALDGSSRGSCNLALHVAPQKPVCGITVALSTVYITVYHVPILELIDEVVGLDFG